MCSQSSVTEFPTSWPAEKDLAKLNRESKNAEAGRSFIVGSILKIFMSLQFISRLICQSGA
jgi:hypothetical protein